MGYGGELRTILNTRTSKVENIYMGWSYSRALDWANNYDIHHIFDTNDAVPHGLIAIL